jgi:RNA 3'-terminal phosphate cyclase
MNLLAPEKVNGVRLGSTALWFRPEQVLITVRSVHTHIETKYDLSLVNCLNLIDKFCLYVRTKVYHSMLAKE